jgi:protein-disulfide isomerase
MNAKMTRRQFALLLATTTLLAAPALAEETATASPEIKDFFLGSTDAKVKIVEYASFTCPHCADFHTENMARLKAEYIDTGKVQFTLREFYRNRFDLWAGMTARCGGEMKYFFVHDLLYDRQQEWTATDDPNAIIANLKTIARTAGMEDAAVDACLKDKVVAEAMVARFNTNAEADAVEGTPTIFINGTRYSNMAYADLKAIIDAELAK